MLNFISKVKHIQMQTHVTDVDSEDVKVRDKLG